MSELHRDTLLARHAIDTDSAHRAVVPPLHLSSTFAFPGFGEKGRYDYTRSGNPTRDQLAEALAIAEGGAAAVVTASGMAAVHLAVQLLKPGDLLVAPSDCYGGCHRLFSANAGRNQFRLELLPLWETRDAVARIRALEPRMVWVETPSNPLLRITDVRVIAAAAHEVGAIVVVDNTFLSPAGQRPFGLGADLVVHSTTKYINGHSDVVGGAVIAAESAVHGELAWWANCLGITGSPFDCFQTLRGLRTLPMRYRQQQETAGLIARMLDEHDLVDRVCYPGLASHPQHELAAQQQNGFGAMVSFEIAAEQAELPVFLGALELFTLAESLGGVESLIAHPATMTHAAMSAEAQAMAGITGRLLRLSVGIENCDDLLADLQRGFEAVRVARQRRNLRNGTF